MPPRSRRRSSGCGHCRAFSCVGAGRRCSDRRRLPASRRICCAGIVHLPVHNTPLKLGSREILFIAIAKARRWIKELTQGRIADFAAIAREEGQTDRHVRKLAALAFLSPRIIAAVIDGTAPANLSAATLSRALPLSWKQQEERLK